MLKLCRDTIIFMMMLLSQKALSNSLLTQHALATSQAISAFYMYSLTEGDDRYQREYSIAIEKAHLQFLALKKDDWQLALELEPLWDRIHGANNFEPTIASGYNVSSYIRFELRKYLDQLYYMHTQTIDRDINLNEQLAFISLDIEILAARFFDVANDTMGARSLSGGDMVVDPVAIAKNMKIRLQKIQSSVQVASIKSKLRAVADKWEFIEECVIDYNQEPAYMLVYYNKNKINSLISESRDILAVL